MVVVVLGCDLLGYGHRVVPIASGAKPEARNFPGPAADRLVNVESWPVFPAVLRNHGVIRAHEPLLGYDRRLPTARRWLGHPEYLGEAWSGGHAVRPSFWSPNRIVFQVRPYQVIHINQNPGSWWLVNGRRAFPDLRCAEWRLPFTARADANGRLELAIHPAGLGLGLGLHLTGLAILAVLALDGVGRARRKTRSESE